MPIKFRCQHCRQFLGISRAKAGAVVDCPTCGRTLRVPKLDGSVEPVSDPKLDLQDDELVRALDELASIGDEEFVDDDVDIAAAADEQVEFASVDRQQDDRVVMLAPVPAAEPVAIDPPLPPEPVSEQADAAGDQDPLVTQVVEYRTANPNPLEELAGLPNEPQPAVADISESAGWKVLLTPLVLMAISIGCAVAFTVGVLVGRSHTIDEPLADQPNGDPANKVANDTNATPKSAANGEAEKPALKGRITFKTESGEIRPDRGARVVVLPAQRVGTAKLSIIGFRAADTAEDFAVSSAALRALGGDIAATDEHGNFEVHLNEAGNYRVVVLSHFHPRENGAQPNEELQTLLDAYFDSPTQLLGRLSYYSTEVRYSGVDTLPLDYSFGG